MTTKAEIVRNIVTTSDHSLFAPVPIPGGQYVCATDHFNDGMNFVNNTVMIDSSTGTTVATDTTDNPNQTDWLAISPYGTGKYLLLGLDSGFFAALVVDVVSPSLNRLTVPTDITTFGTTISIASSSGTSVVAYATTGLFYHPLADPVDVVKIEVNAVTVTLTSVATFNFLESVTPDTTDGTFVLAFYQQPAATGTIEKLQSDWCPCRSWRTVSHIFPCGTAAEFSTNCVPEPWSPNQAAARSV